MLSQGVPIFKNYFYRKNDQSSIELNMVYSSKNALNY